MSNTTKNTGLLPMNKFFKSFFDNDSFFGHYMDKWWDTAQPAMNIAESDSGYSVDIVAPGFKKEDININVENDVLTISAEAKEEREEEKKEYTRKEYNFSSFKHSFHLPDNVKEDEINASYADGVLKLTMPKTNKQITASKKIAID